LVSHTARPNTRIEVSRRAWIWLWGRGDPSDEFKFSTFFPEVVQPPIDRVAGALAVLLRLQRKPEQAEPAKGFVLGGAALPGSDTAEASRRRWV
jgi:hypothetical protein